MPTDVLILRTHAADPCRDAALARFGAFAELRLVAAVTATRGPVHLPAGVEGVMLDLPWLKEAGLATPPDWGWRCGDYALYAVRRAVPDARFYWLTDSDVVVNARPDGFFARFAASDADLLAPGLRRRPPGWAHHPAMARFGAEVWGCLFSFLRISGRAIDHLLPRRQALLARWQAANAAGPQLKWPNDESFVATELHDAGMPMADLNDFGHRVYGRDWGWHFPIHPAAPAFDRPDGQIYHPVAADTAGFLRRIERTLPRLEAAGDAGRILPGLARALKTLPLDAGRPVGLDPRPEAEAALAALLAASVLPGLGEGIQHLASGLFPPREGVAEITHHAVTARPGPGWRVAAADDFRLGPAVAAPCLPRGQATAYAADFATRRLALTLAPSGSGLLAAPFFYQAQREAARSVALLPFDRLAEAYPAVEDPSAAPLIVMSPGRCGSTFMNGLLAAAGLTAVSEPDTFAQASGLMGREAAQAGRGAGACRADAVAVLRATVASLAAATATEPDRLALKLRSQANPAVAAIRDAFPQARFVFLFRDVESWVRSFVTAFGHPAPRLVSSLAAAIRACAMVAGSGSRLAIMSYEQLARDPAAALEALAAAGLLAGPAPGTAALEQVAAADSQAGTSVSREARAARGAGDDPAVTATLAAFRDLWPAARPAAEIARLGLPF